MRNAAVVFLLAVGLSSALAQSPAVEPSPAAAEQHASLTTPPANEATAVAPIPVESAAPAQAPILAPAETVAPAQPPVPVKPPVVAEACPGNPNAIGTSRTIKINPVALPLIGTMQYRNSVPLNDHEVVLTFDDGPIPPYTTAILDILASQCVKATYFLVGEMVRPRPYLVRRIYNEGHSIGTHSQNHPFAFQNLSLQRAENQVEGGIDAAKAALGDPNALSPFFRIPGFGRTNAIEHYLESKQLVTWSADIDPTDWRRGSSPGAIVQRVMRQLESKGKGIVLLHDIHPATVLALPVLLKTLKANGYRIVHVEATGERPKTLPELPAPAVADGGNWPKVLKVSASNDDTESRPVRRARTRVAHRSGRTRVAHNDSDAGITASISKKRSKAKTAASTDAWMSLQR